MEESIFVITASAQYINQGLSELQELDAGAKAVKLLDNGIAIIESKLEQAVFTETVKKGKPVFIRHMHGVDQIVALEGNGPQKAADAAAGYKDRILPGQRVAVQVRKGSGDYEYSPMDIKNAVDTVLSDVTGAVPEVKEPEQIISILLCDGKGYMGLGRRSDNISAWSGGMVHYRKSVNDVSRAKFKLMEAIEVFQLEMGDFRTALDLGAAPGGWTSVLLEHGLQVTAVDTGDMDERLLKHPGLTFIKTNAAELKLEGSSFDLLTSDISWNPKNTARLINTASQYLKEGGSAVVTLKLMGEKARKTIKEVLSIYKEVFEVLRVKQLFHNRDEVTLYLRKR
jgi:23S rRNA (cytidine2498-2'-O)-methyltransferase